MAREGNQDSTGSDGLWGPGHAEPDALEHMGKALEKLAKGEPDKAIEEYKKAWEDARNAL